MSAHSYSGKRRVNSYDAAGHKDSSVWGATGTENGKRKRRGWVSKVSQFISNSKGKEGHYLHHYDNKK